MKRTGDLIVLLQNKKWMLLLSNRLNKKIKSIGLFHDVNEDTFGQFGLTKNIFRKSGNIFNFWSTCCPTALYMLNMEKMIRAEIKNQKLVKFICPRQPNKWNRQKGQKEKEILENTFFKKIFWKYLLFNSLYCGVVPCHHTKTKLNFKSQESENKQICCGI